MSEHRDPHYVPEDEAFVERLRQSGVTRPLRQRLVDEARSARREAQAGMRRYKEALAALDKAGIPRSVAYREDEG